jgi:hypothetical protein
MGIARWAPPIGVTAVVVAVLVSCSPPPEPPRPATAEEIQALRDEQARAWWDDFADGAPMPDVEVVEVLPLEESFAQQAACMIEAGIPGVRDVGDGTYSYSFTDDDDPNVELVQQRQWICSQRYPVKGDDDFILSRSELTWLYDFFMQRHRPCLHSLGYEFVTFPERDQFVEDAVGYPSWVPDDYSVDPVPSREQWALLAERCPLPSLLGEYNLPGSESFG